MKNVYLIVKYTLYGIMQLPTEGTVAAVLRKASKGVGLEVKW